MKCETILERLDEYIDGELDDRERESVREHLEVCATCSRERESTVRLLQQARELSLDEEPSRDLWVGIRGRITEPAVGSRSTRGRLVLVAAAAILILAVVSGPRLLDPVDRTGNDPLAASGQVMPVSYQEADERFAELRDQLLADLTCGEDRLDPEMVRMVRKSLKVMDDSSAEIRKALAADPGNSGLRRMLLASYHHQAKLLTRVREYPETM